MCPSEKQPENRIWLAGHVSMTNINTARFFAKKIDHCPESWRANHPNALRFRYPAPFSTFFLAEKSYTETLPLEFMSKVQDV
jgi:hypothetical protein